ncbi:two-component response regulator ARR1-like [Salvia miltiorrhiza]|uniref:two-component response regulator ARR1-like n=1 Tax=Salvia miltiorrhiza TaxID=226208 RepID=UPI0025AC4116|nr:two-component response regulator ARR1-like [Salvia miltiorrhiza]
MHEIHVLLVDHDAEALNIAKQLEMWQYKVSCAELASPAIPMLANAKFDVVMANINSPDPHGFKLLLQHALNMWMADDDNAFVAMRALENGAFLCIKKPPPMEFLRSLWQHVMREKARMIRERDILVASNNLGSVRGIEFREVVHHRSENPNPKPNPNSNPNPNMMMKNKGKFKTRSRGRYDDYDGEYDSDNNIMSQNGNVRRKMCTEWTQELHAKFMNAVEQLGEGRCFPKEILELMNEPGLTRMQVASHLQKCRNDNWRSPEERKPTLQTSHHSSPNCSNRTQSKPRRFGSMPLVNKPSIQQETGQSSETLWEPNNGAKMENGSTMINNTPHHYGSNPRHASDEYFNFPDMDSLIHDFSGRQQEPEIDNPSPVQEVYQVDPAYNDDKNSGEASMKTKSH